MTQKRVPQVGSAAEINEILAAGETVDLMVDAVATLLTQAMKRAIALGVPEDEQAHFAMTSLFMAAATSGALRFVPPMTRAEYFRLCEVAYCAGPPLGAAIIARSQG